MLDGQWNLHFISQFRDIDGGVVEISDNKICGGDADFSYLGDFDLKDGVLSGELKAIGGEERPHCLFGFQKQFRIYLHGNVQSSQMFLTGYLANNPTVRIKLHFTKID